MTRHQPPPADPPFVDANGYTTPCPNCGAERALWELELPLQCLAEEPKSTAFVEFLGTLAVEIVRDRAARGEGAA